MQLFSADAMVFSKKFWNFFLTPKKWKNGPQKLLIIGPDPFITQTSPGHSPQPKIDFPYHEVSGPDICSLICEASMVLQNYHHFIEMTSNTIYIVAHGFKCPRKIQLNTQCPPSPYLRPWMRLRLRLPAGPAACLSLVIGLSTSSKQDPLWL